MQDLIAVHEGQQFPYPMDATFIIERRALPTCDPLTITEPLTRSRSNITDALSKFNTMRRKGHETTLLVETNGRAVPRLRSRWE